MMVSIRLATAEDTDQMLTIYRPVIENTSTSFEFQVPTPTEFSQRVKQVQLKYPWLVCQRGAEIAGYAYAGSHRTRAAYQWTTELSVYVNAKFHRKGVAQALYTSLCALLRLQGYRSALAGITLPNDSSEQFHKNFGFTPIGVYQNVGYKMGDWHAVGWWEMSLIANTATPQSPLSLAEVQTHRLWQEALDQGLSKLTL